ncbi:hypothetical protein BKA66DRAFT_575010 [Pyrenochaeta sp. MPI-SDFR-AT-0127]|nr:hypothetical protein BKA66DRAFT_575010 [Pyrenochaeta sp. MPI-SDFR-AT-0127]
MDITPQQRNPTPSRASVLPQMTIPEIPPFRGPSFSAANGNAPTPQPVQPLQSPIRTQTQVPLPSQVQKPLPPLLGQQPLPSLMGQKPLPSSQQPFASFSPSSSSSRPDSASSNDPFGGPLISDWNPKSMQPNIAHSPAPPPPPHASKPSPMSRGSFGRPKPTSNHPSLLQTPGSPTAPIEITALTGVVVPALEAALSRRTYHLNLKNKQESAQSLADPQGFIERKRQRQECHDRVKRLANEIKERFEELDRWDERGEVGMGGEVAGFLEGFLEEVLVRVEPADD